MSKGGGQCVSGAAATKLSALPSPSSDSDPNLIQQVASNTQVSEKGLEHGPQPGGAALGQFWGSCSNSFTQVTVAVTCVCVCMRVNISTRV